MFDRTGENIPKEGQEKIWSEVVYSNLEEYKNKLGKNYLNDPAHQALLGLFKKTKEQEEKFRKQTEELENAKKDSQQIVSDLKSEAKEYREKIKKELDLWRIITMGVVIVTAIGFITLILDTFWRRNDDFHKMNLEYNNKVNSLENKSDIIELEKEQLNKEIGDQQIILENFKKQQDCLGNKRYWQYEQCFK